MCRARHSPAAGRVKKCQVSSCRIELREGYNARYRICHQHATIAAIEIGGRAVRFCSLCRRFQPLADFEGAKRSCREKLAEHNYRRALKRSRAALAAEAEAGAAVRALLHDQQLQQEEEEEEVVEEVPAAVTKPQAAAVEAENEAVVTWCPSPPPATAAGRPAPAPRGTATSPAAAAAAQAAAAAAAADSLGADDPWGLLQLEQQEEAAQWELPEAYLGLWNDIMESEEMVAPTPISQPQEALAHRSGSSPESSLPAELDLAMDAWEEEGPSPAAAQSPQPARSLLATAAAGTAPLEVWDFVSDTFDQLPDLEWDLAVPGGPSQAPLPGPSPALAPLPAFDERAPAAPTAPRGQQAREAACDEPAPAGLPCASPSASALALGGLLSPATPRHPVDGALLTPLEVQELVVETSWELFSLAPEELAPGLRKALYHMLIR